MASAPVANLWTTDLAQCEDGVRVAVAQGTFEWWYFDAVLDDGSTCVITFLNKTPFVPGPLKPELDFSISRPDGTYIQQNITIDPASYSADSKRCSVVMGPNRAEGDLHTYTVHAQGDGIAADLTLRGIVPGWRTGPFLNPAQAAAMWLGEQVVIPSGTVEGTLTYDGATHAVRGHGYHDHQWGGPAAPALPPGFKLTSWYWGRVRVGDRAVVFAQVLGASTTPGGPSVPIPVIAVWFYARGTHVTFNDDPAALTIEPLVASGGGPAGVNNGIAVAWTNGLGTVRLTLAAPKQIAAEGAAYQRFLSPATLVSDYDGEPFSGQSPGIWEIMLLG